MLAQIVDMIELVRLQIGARGVDVGQGRFAQYAGGDVLDREIRDFMNEADVLVFAGRDPRDDLAPGDLRVDDGLAAAPSVIDHHDKVLHADDLGLIRELESNGGSISENQKKVQREIRRIRKSRSRLYFPDPAGRITLLSGRLLLRRPSAWRLGRLARPRQRLVAQAFDLASRQSNADLADPFELYTADRLGIEAREIDQCCRFSPLDRLQIALAGLQAHGGFLAVEARERMMLLAKNHDNIAIFVFWQHGIAGNLEGDGLFGNREG